MPRLSDPADALLARTDDLEIHTQHQMALDSAPDFHGSSEDEEALFAGLAGKPVKKIKLPAQAGVRQVKPGARPAPRMGGFMPGMGDLGDVGTARKMGRPAPKVLSRGQNKQTKIAYAGPRSNGGFIPGLGDLGAVGTARKLGRAPARVLSRGQNKQTKIAYAGPRSNGGFIPGLGDFSVAGLGIGTLALLGVGAYFLLRKRA